VRSTMGRFPARPGSVAGERCEGRPVDAILTLACPDRPGIVAAVAACLARDGADIRDSQQFGDGDTGRFFMRVHAQLPGGLGLAAVRSAVAGVAAEFGMDWELVDQAARARILVLASRAGHCLNDLLYRWQTGWLPADIVAVACNHETLRPTVAAFDVPYHHLPVHPRHRGEQEAALLELVERHRVDLVVLARYMQILSPAVCTALAGRAINIHHSFLPSFAGAQPYRQAHDRGVKLIGATAHYVTADLDDGPIIEQDVARVDHSLSPAELAAVGRDVESVVLARAVRWHVEHRVLVNGPRTIVFR
jgi:formyltetrahydrofolate deformylase